MVNTKFAWCLLCQTLLESSDCTTFQTGFRQIDGVDYPLAVCKNCSHECADCPWALHLSFAVPGGVGRHLR